MSYAEVVHLFLKADRHLSKVDPKTRSDIMERARTVLLDPAPQYAADLTACLVSVPPRPRQAFVNTLRKACVIAREAIQR